MEKQWGGARKGAGRKNLENKKISVSFQLTQEELNFIDSYSGKSRSERLRNIINEYKILKK